MPAESVFQSEHIERLLKHGDIKETSLPAIATIDFYGKTYQLSKNFQTLLKRIFDYYISGYIEFNWIPTDDFQTKVKNRWELSGMSNSKERQVEFYTSLIAEENKSLSKLIGEISSVNTFDTNLSNWLFYLMEESEELVYCIKFRILDGKPINEFKFPFEVAIAEPRDIGAMDLIEELELESTGFDTLDKYFLTDKLRSLYEANQVMNNIRYLQQLVQNLENKPQQRIKAKDNLEDAFYKPEYFTKAIDALKTMKTLEDDRCTPKISDGAFKKILRFWFDHLEEEGYVDKFETFSRFTKAKMFNKYFNFKVQIPDDGGRLESKLKTSTKYEGWKMKLNELLPGLK